MDIKEILKALQAGKINPEAAKQQFIDTVKPRQDEIKNEKTNIQEANQPVVKINEIEAGIIQITMQDKANKNAFSDELAEGLTNAFREAEANINNKVIILTGYEGYFSLGGTKDRLLDIHDGKAKYTDTTVYRLALDCKLPVIAAMQGHAFGAGWCMGMFSDFIVMSRESVYSANFMKFGFTPGAGSTLIFAEKFGAYLANEILFTGRRYHGEDLQAKGTAIPVVPQREVLSHAIELAKGLCEASREALIILKDHMVASIRKGLTDIINKELIMHEKTFLNKAQVKENIQALYGHATHKPQNQVQNKDISSNAHTSAYLHNEPIAIIGMSGRFPKAKNLKEYWNNIKNGRNCISEVPSARWLVEEYFDADPKTPGKTYSKWMGVLEDEDKFDPLFFNISPNEAEFMDPQQRLFLESCWQCIEDAGINPNALSGSRCGVFAGCVAGDYGQLVGADGLNAQGLMGSSNSILAARISYVLNLKGPSISIDTACSASLYAIAEACNSLILRTSDIAIAGGVGIMAGPAMHIMSSKAGMLSPDGQCFTFDNRANGFVPGEGAGVVMLKRLSDAVRDKDNICGVIKGWGVNQDGKTNGITAPSSSSQSALEREVYQRFGINPENITMVEAHGTGTKLGDPIEIEALTEAFKSFTDRSNYCALGSVKSNIGHLFAAAGAAGVIKVLLAIRNKQLPPTINFEKLNEHISLENSPFYVNTTLQPWTVDDGRPRCAAISSFGFSGTNVHMVIEEYISTEVKMQAEDEPVIFVLSAKTEERLKVYAKEMMSFIAQAEPISIKDTAYTLQVGRLAMDYRLAVTAGSKAELLTALDNYIKGIPSDIIFTSSKVTNEPINIASIDIEASDKLEELMLIAGKWVKGARFDWNNLYAISKPNRISLPVYPFARERYWKANVASISTTDNSIIAEAASTERMQGDASIEACLKEMVSNILGVAIDRIDCSEQLTSYGFDSISGMSLISNIKHKFNIELSPKIVFEFNSINHLKGYLINEMGLKEAILEKEVETEAEQQSEFPLSAAQMGLWLIDQLSPDSYAYNLPTAFRLKGKADAQALKAAFDKLVRRHGILTAAIETVGREPVHVIKDDSSYYFEEVDVSHLSESELKAYIDAKAHQPFDLAKGTLMRVYLISRNAEEHILLINIHHIIFDGSSLPILLKELVKLYSAELSGCEAVLPQQRKTYADFVSWQSEMLKSNTGQRHKEYWQKKLSGQLPVLDLPFSKPKSDKTALKGKTYIQSISAELTRKLQGLCTDEKVSPFVTMLSAFKALLYKYTNQEDIMIGTAMQGRPDAEYENIIGYFINMALIRSSVSGEASFRELIRQVQTNTYEALEHGLYPFSEVVKDNNHKNNQSRGSSSLIQYAFVFQNWLKNTDQLFGTDKEAENTLTLEPIQEIHQEGEFDLSLEVIKDENNYKLFFKYNPELFEEEAIAAMCGHYVELLKAVAQNSQQKLAEIDYITAEEKNKLLTEWIDTNAEYPRDKCVQQLFEEQVSLNPENTAVLFKAERLTYHQLNQKANQLARHLRAKGAKPDSIVAIMVERSLEMPIGLFGIIKAGGAYLPIDPAYPKDRIEYILQNSKADILLVAGKSKIDIEFNGQIIEIQDEEIQKLDASNPECINKPTDLAYVIYTSGSTGNPKGAMLEHHSLINRLKWMQKAYSLTKADIILQKTPYTFDVSVWEQFWWSLEGAKVCFLPPKEEKDPQAIAEAIEKYQITVMHFVPSMLNMFLEYISSYKNTDRLRSLKQVFASGEALTLSQVNLFNELLNKTNNTRLMNLYGPTEATIDVSYFDCSTGEKLDRIPIGKPIDNIQLYIIDRNNKLQPAGIPGELCIAGVGLARGYLNNSKLTAEKFVDNPFEANTKMYKTGDLAKWLPDGNIEYLGRIDRQIKIRGFRIELGEIEAVLMKHDNIKEACVIVDKEKDITGNDRLKAYVVSKDKQALITDSLRSYLKEKLPEYMVPAVFVCIDNIPLTAHGKADVKALQAYEADTLEVKPADGTNESSAAEQDGIKGIVTAVYREMLQLNDINPNANFFDLGGHSLLLVKAAIRLKELLNREVTTVDMFQYTTINSLSQHLSVQSQEQNKEADSINTFTKSKQKAKRQRDILMKLNQAY